MIDPHESKRLQQYLSLTGGSVKITEFLGGGTDGDVWATNRNTATKLFASTRESGYLNERDTYQRLAEFGVTQKIAGFWIPQMRAWNDDLLVVEMDLMQEPPYIIDFAKVSLNRSPDFSVETQRDNEERGRERFEHNWPAVQSLLAELESYLIFYLDPTPYNIVFPG